MGFKIKFWGVRGSLPAPMTEMDFSKTLRSLEQEYLQKHGPDLSGFLPFVESNCGNNVHGGNTSCVELVAGDGERFIADAGTGIRPLGDHLMKTAMFRSPDDKGIKVTVCISHIHWDHIQGIPFFAPLYMNKADGFYNDFLFLGGTKWQSSAETCLAGQMDPPNFPVSWEKIKEQTRRLNFGTVGDKFSMRIGDTDIKTRVLDHPQETYGWRFTHNGKVAVYATDNECRDPMYPSPELLDLSKNADVLIIDCQYSRDQYNGKVGGPHRHGWGHSYPLAVANTAADAGVKKLVLFHHDPNSTRLDIASRVLETKTELAKRSYDCEVVAAWEGLEISI